MKARMVRLILGVVICYFPSTCLPADCVSPPADLAGWWPGDGSSANLWGTNQAVLKNGATYAPGCVANAFHLDGVDDFVEASHSPDLVATGSLTVVTWVKPTVALSRQASWGRLVDKYDLGTSTTGRRGWALMTSGNSTSPGRLGFEVADGTGTASAGWKSVWTAEIDLALSNRWTHLAGVYDLTAGNLGLYANGVLRTQSVISPYGAASTTLPLRFGCDSKGTSRFKGDLDEVVIFNRALSADEIAVMYAAGTNGMCKDQVPAGILAHPQDVARRVREAASFTVTGRGSSPLSYQWLKDASPLSDNARVSGATSDTLTITSLQLGDAGPYSAVVSNPFGQTKSTTATLTVLPNPLPDPWLETDVGNLSQHGGSTYANGAFTIQALGASWKNSQDQFHFVYQPLAREGGVRVRVVNQDRTSRGAVMIRENLGAGLCREVWMNFDTTYGQSLYWRAASGAWSNARGFTYGRPFWLKLVRAGDWFTGFLSGDGLNWTVTGTVSLTLPDLADVGMAVAGGPTVFDEVSAWSGPEPAPDHSVRRRVWFGLPGSAVSDLTSSAAFAGPAHLEDSLRAFESEGLGTNYGQCLSGYLAAPETGPYVFHLASDDAAQLWLAPAARLADRALIVEEMAWAARRDWSKRSSAPIDLEAGQLYYLEALHKQGTGGDYLGVAWTLPYRLPPDNGSAPIPSAYFLFGLPESPPHIVEQPRSQELWAGLDAVFTVQAEGPPLSFQWRKDDQDLVDNAWVHGATTETLYLAEVQPADAGRYTVVVRNLAGGVESDPALLTVGLPYGEKPAAPLLLQVELPSASEVRLSWADSWPDVVLEVIDEFSESQSWMPLAVSPTPGQGRYWVSLPATPERRFFRLRATSVMPPPIGLPPDPVAVAPSVPSSVVTTLSEATRFLYTGPNAVQLGVAEETIEPERAAGLRGRVITRDGTALSGVDVRILDHPEFGYTRTRADGQFDMVLNGGGLLTVRLQRAGYLPAQRQINVPWQDYAQVPDLALVPHDPLATTIDLSSAAPIQMARGSRTIDSDGARQATLLFPEGTRAALTLPDGSTQPLTTLHVRATEYTVGPYGPNAMPAELPPTIGYTYCVELGVDEADAVGAKTVTFNQPVPFYVENFLGFPVGGIVPAGYYDKEQAVWVPSDNGLVIKILGQTDGRADLDITGGNMAADAASLAALSITDAERVRLASLYAKGQSLWRVPIPHLSSWDCNWGWGPPLNAVFPMIPSWLYENPQPCPPCEGQNQTCKQAVPVSGTSVSLHYNSERTPGCTAANTIEIPYSHTNVPPSTKRIELVVEVSGRKFTNSFDATPNGRFSFLWDGKDAYGRQVQGCQRVTMRVGFVYDGKYQSPATLYGTFGHNFLPEEMTVNSRQECTFWQQLVSFIGGWHSHGLGLGGWTLSNHHAYDPISRTVYYGDGRKRQAVSTGRTIDLSAGGGTNNWDYGIPATALKMYDPQGVAIAPTGELYIADTGEHRILKVDRNGMVQHVAGNSGCGGAFAGDGGQAVSACLNRPTYLAFGPDGALYFTDSENDRIRRIELSGMMSTVAGGGTPGDGLGDGGAATDALLIDPKGIAVGRDGRLFIADYGHSRVRVVSPEGIIQTAAGGGLSEADGAPAAQSKLGNPVGLAVTPDGTLYLSYMGRLRGATSNGQICRVDPVGRLSLFAGAHGNPPVNGRDARIAALQMEAVAVGPDGDVYVWAWWSGTVLCRIGADGLIHHVAGRLYAGGYGGNGGPAVGAPMGSVPSMTFGPDGRIYWTEKTQWGPHVVRHATLPLPGFDGGALRIPSEDGAQLFEFDQAGRHLRTLDSLTGAEVDTFHYNASGLLTSVTDGDGNITTIERALDGAPLAIIGPFGQRTALETDGDGNLSRIEDPANSTHAFAYGAGGLLQSVVDPRTNKFNFAYDTDGRLVREESAGCCAGELSRSQTNTTTTVTVTSPEGRPTSYASEILTTGEVRQRNIFPDGTANDTLTGIDASRVTTFADGATVTEQDGGDARFGMEAPVLKSQTVSTPGGLTRSLAVEQQMLLSDPSDPLRLLALTNLVSVNGRTNISRYDGATRTFTATTPAGRQTLTVADAQSRPVRIEVPGLEPVRLTYDPRGRIESMTEGRRQSSFGYEPLTGYLVAATNALGQVTRFASDAAGAVTNVALGDGAQWAMARDGNGNLLSLTEPNGTNVHGLTYTQHNLLETYRSPLGAVERFTYNTDQELVRRELPSGRALQWVYATNGHLIEVQTLEGVTPLGYDPDSGLLARAISGDGQQMDFAYDGSLLTNVAWSGPVAGAVSYTYDNDFRVAVMAYAGLRLTNRFDADGLPTNIGSVNLTYSPTNGFLCGIADSAFQIAYQRSAHGEITNTVAKLGGERYRVDREYDDLGRISRRTETIAAATTTFDYRYDAVGQLVEVKRDGVTVEAYAYDAVGNRIGMTNTLTGQTLTAADYHYDADNKLLQAGVTTFAYDADGRLTTETRSGAVTSWHYNTDGTLAGLDLPDGRQITYLHDSRGRRIARAVNGVRTHAWLYGDGLMPLAEYDGTGGLRTTFLYGGRWTPVAFIRGGVTYHIVTDHLGSPRLVVNGTGTVVKWEGYDAFGNVVLDTAPTIDLPFGFAGGLADPEHELMRFGARDYQPSSARWTAKDPILIAGAFNLYLYVGNDPVNRLDVSGTEESFADQKIRELTAYFYPIFQKLMERQASKTAPMRLFNKAKPYADTALDKAKKAQAQRQACANKAAHLPDMDLFAGTRLTNVVGSYYYVGDAGIGEVAQIPKALAKQAVLSKVPKPAVGTAGNLWDELWRPSMTYQQFKELIVHVKALACELPATHHVPLSRWSLDELTRHVCQTGLVAQVSGTTLWRWLHEDAIRPWQHRCWIFPRDPNFAPKAGRILDLYQRQWQGEDLQADEFVLSTDEKTSIQARRRLHPTVSPEPRRPMKVEHEYERKGAWAYLAAWDVHRAKLFGRCEVKSGMAPFDRLVAQVMNQEPYRSARRVFWIMDNGSSHEWQVVKPSRICGTSYRRDCSWSSGSDVGFL